MNKRALEPNQSPDAGVAESARQLEWLSQHLSIRYLGDSVLRLTCTPVAPDDIGKPSIQEIIDGLIDTIRTYREHSGSGRGIAANQIGYSKRIIVVWLEDEPVVMLNPAVNEVKGLASYEESCMSGGLIIGEVHRPWLATITYLDQTGAPHTIEPDAIGTRVMLHEIDHLNGVHCSDLYQPRTMRLVRRGAGEILGSQLKVLSEA